MDRYERFRETARARFGRLNPFRLGIAVGASGRRLASPYPAGSRGRQAFLEGRNWALANQSLAQRHLAGDA